MSNYSELFCQQWRIAYCYLRIAYCVLRIATCVLGIGYWVLGIGYWVLGIGYWVLGIGIFRIGYWHIPYDWGTLCAQDNPQKPIVREMMTIPRMMCCER